MSKREDMRINMLKVFSREVLLHTFIKTLQKISKLFVFDTEKALTKMHVMLLISSAMKAKLGVGLNYQNFLRATEFLDAGSLSLICYTIQFAQLANRGVSQFQTHKDLAVKSSLTISCAQQADCKPVWFCRCC